MCGDHAAVLGEIDDTGATGPALPAVGNVAEAASVAQPDAHEGGAEVVDVVMAHVEHLHVATLDHRGKHATVDLIVGKKGAQS